MTPVIDIIMIVVGVVLIAGSRVIADAFSVPSEDAFTRFIGMAEDWKSRLRRWTVAVVVGVIFMVVGVLDLVGYSG